MSLRYTTLRPDGTWTARQSVTFRPSGPSVLAEPTPIEQEGTGVLTVNGRSWTLDHPEPIDDYHSAQIGMQCT
jgi:hypothetical protein